MEDQDDTLTSLDLYDDLITDEGLSRQENYNELSKKYDAAVLKIIELESKVDTLQKSESQLSEKCGILEKNISTLFLTARLELQRKDRVIQQYKHMREPRKQTNTASASNLRLDRDDRRFNSERSKQHGDSILVDKVKTKRRLSSDDREEKIKKKRKLSEKTCGEENASKSLNTTTRTDNCGQNAARKILEKSRKDIQRRLSGGKPSSHEYEHDKNKEREKKKRSTESKSSANECSKSERHDRREKKRQNNVGNEKRGETKTKDSGIKTTSGNVHSVEETRNKTTASRGVLDLRDKLKMKRFKDEKSFKKDNVLENKRNPCSISKVDSISDSPKEKMKSVGDILSPKHKNRSSSSNRNRQGNRSSEEQYPQIGLVAKSCNTKESDHELKKKVSSISKPRSDCDKQVNQNRKSSADAKSSLDSERLKSRSKCSQGVVASDEHCTDNNLLSESSSLFTHVKKTSSLESTLPDQVTNNLEKCSSPQVNEVLVSGSKENTSSFSHLKRANETCSESKKSKKESADSPDPTSVERISSQLPLQETEEENISDKTILNDEANQIKGKLKDAPTTGQVRKNDQDEQQKSHLFSVGNGKSEDMSAVHSSEPVLSSPVVDRNCRKSRESSLSAASVMEECQTSDTCLQSVTQEICLKTLKSVGSRETTHPMESCTGARYHSKEKLAEKEKQALEIASYNVSQTKLGDVKKNQVTEKQ